MNSLPIACPVRLLSRPAWLGLSLLIAPALSAGIHSRPFTLPQEKTEPAKGIPYFLPKPVLLVHTSPELDATGKVKAIQVELQQQTVADRTQGFLLLTKNGPFTAATTSFEVADGLLSSINDTRESKLPDAIQSIASFVFSLQTIPALEAQVAALDPTKIANIQVNKNREVLVESWKNLATRDSAVAAFRKHVEDSPDYSDAVKSLVRAVDDQTIIRLMVAAQDDLNKNGQPVTFEQLMDGVDQETLKQGVARMNPPQGSVEPVLLGNRLRLEVELEFGESCTSVSTYHPTEAVPAGLPHPGGATHRAANTATREVKSEAYRDRIIVRGERPVAIKTTLKPNPDQVADILVSSLQEEVEPLAALVTGGVSDEATWQTTQAELEKKSAEAGGKAAAATTAYLDQLETLLKLETSLSDGRGQLGVAVLPVYAAQKTALITKLETNAKKAAAALDPLGDSFGDFRDKLLTLLIKLHIADGDRSQLAFSPDWTFASRTTLATFPAPEAYQIPLESLVLGKSTSGLQLSRGLLRSISSTSPAPAAELVSLPAKVVSPYIAMLKELITIRVSTIEQADDALEQQVAIAKLENDLKELTKQPAEDPAATAHAQAIAELTRTKELLELQKTILELQKATQTP